jgi:hypothetical protein
MGNSSSSIALPVLVVPAAAAALHVSASGCDVRWRPEAFGLNWDIHLLRLPDRGTQRLTQSTDQTLRSKDPNPREKLNYHVHPPKWPWRATRPA